MIAHRRQLLLPTRPEYKAFYTDAAITEAAFITLRNGLGGYLINFPEKHDVTLDEIDYCERRRQPIGTSILAVNDGFVLNSITRAGLFDLSHRLKIPTGSKNVNYHRDAFNIDSQCIGPRPLNLDGEEAISKNKDALKELLCFERDIVYAALTKWEGWSNSTRTKVARC